VELDTVVVDGIPCTTIARTLVDLAAVLPYWLLETAVERAEYLGLLDLRAIAEVLARISRPRGVRNLRRSLGPVRLDAAVAGSALERRYLGLILDAGIARPVLQAGFELTPGASLAACSGQGRPPRRTAASARAARVPLHRHGARRDARARPRRHPRRSRRR
jgi:hypothetical protein